MEALTVAIISHFRKLFFPLVMLLSSANCFAVLGGSADSVEADRQNLKSFETLKKTSAPLYSIHTITSDALTLNEFVSQDGVVFGLSWSGTIHPDLESILGTYQSEYQTALSSTPMTRGLKKRSLQTSKLVIEQWGHPRHLQGRMFDPNLIPKGVGVNEIR